MPLLILTLLISLLFPFHSFAEEIYQTRDDFIFASFDGKPPSPDYIWISNDLRPQVNKIMEHSYPVIKIKYWQKGLRTVWILEEIGKVKLITTGFIINKNKIEFLKILAYRESHGREVKDAFFTDQFKDVQLINGEQLSRSIDNISGATMSVDAVRNLGKLALYLHEQVVNEKQKK